VLAFAGRMAEPVTGGFPVECPSGTAAAVAIGLYSAWLHRFLDPGRNVPEGAVNGAASVLSR
jgi:hypothetical protein